MNKKITDAIREVFGAMDSSDFCGCYEGDLDDQYWDGVDKFLKKLEGKMNEEAIEAASRLLARVAEDTEMAGLSDTGFKQSLSNAINGLVELL